MPSCAGSKPSNTSDQAEAGSDRHLDLRQIGHDDIGAGVAQRLRLFATIDADDAAERAGAAGLDTGDRVLDDDGARGFDAEATRRLQKGIRRRLALESEAGDVRPVDSRIEQLRDTRGIEHGRAVVARGHDGGLDVLRPELRAPAQSPRR